MADRKKIPSPFAVAQVKPSEHKKLTAKEIAEMVKLIKEVGSHKKNGFIFIGTVVPTKSGIDTNINGYVRCVAKVPMLASIFESVDANPIQVLAAMAEMRGGIKRSV